MDLAAASFLLIYRLLFTASELCLIKEVKVEGHNITKQLKVKDRLV